MCNFSQPFSFFNSLHCVADILLLVSFLFCANLERVIGKMPVAWFETEAGCSG